MKKIFLNLPLLIWLSATVFSQPTVWKNYYAKYPFYLWADNGNYLQTINANQLVQFDKSTGYFQYDELPVSVMANNSGHSGLVVTPHELRSDKNGNLWLLTSHGINRFDGTNWVTWDSTFFNNGMSFMSSQSLLTDRDGSLWFTSNTHGLIHFTGSSYVTFDTLNSNIPSYNFTSIMQQDTAGNIWYADKDSGLVKFNGSTFKHYNHTTIGYPANQDNWYFYGIHINPLTNEVFATTNSSLFYYIYNGTTWQQLQLDSNITGYYYGSIDIFFDGIGNTYFSVAKNIHTAVIISCYVRIELKLLPGCTIVDIVK